MHNKPYMPDSPLVMSSYLIIILHMEKYFLMKSKFRRAYLSNGLEFVSEIKSGVLSDENSMLF
jgi:hypothetical protein